MTASVIGTTSPLRHSQGGPGWDDTRVPAWRPWPRTWGQQRLLSNPGGIGHAEAGRTGDQVEAGDAIESNKTGTLLTGPET